MGKSVTAILNDVYEAINEAVNATRNTEILWEDNVKYTSDGVFESVNRNFKIIIGVHDWFGEGEANSIQTAIENTLNAPENLIGGNGKNKELHPYKLTVKVIHVQGDISLSKKKIAVTLKQSKKDLLENCNYIHNVEISKHERMVSKAKADVDLAKAKNYTESTIEEFKKTVKAYEDALAIREKERDDDIELIKKLPDDGRYKISYYKPNARLYQMTYYDTISARRHRMAVGDIVIAIGADKVDESQRYRRTRSDSYESDSGILPRLECFHVYEDKSPAKPVE